MWTGTAIPYMWVIFCLVGTFGERLAAFARVRKRSDVNRGHMWASTATGTGIGIGSPRVSGTTGIGPGTGWPLYTIQSGPGLGWPLPKPPSSCPLTSSLALFKTQTFRLLEPLSRFAVSNKFLVSRNSIILSYLLFSANGNSHMCGRNFKFNN